MYCSSRRTINHPPATLWYAVLKDDEDAICHSLVLSWRALRQFWICEQQVSLVQVHLHLDCPRIPFRRCIPTQAEPSTSSPTTRWFLTTPGVRPAPPRKKRSASRHDSYISPQPWHDSKKNDSTASPSPISDIQCKVLQPRIGQKCSEDPRGHRQASRLVLTEHQSLSNRVSVNRL